MSCSSFFDENNLLKVNSSVICCDQIGIKFLINELRNKDNV